MRKLLKHLFKRKEVRKCSHLWHRTGDDFIMNCFGGSVESDSAVWIYCPKCKTEELVYRKEWERIEKKQEIDRHYNDVDRLEFKKHTI